MALTTISNITSEIVHTRLVLSELASRLKAESDEYLTAVDSLLDSIDSMYEAEKYLGEAHHNVLVANATMTHAMNTK